MQIAQCDLWFPPAEVPLGFGQAGSPPVLVMVAGYSRWLSAVMIPSRQIPDLLLGHWAIISALGVAPRMLVWDNESGIGQWRGGKPQLTAAMNAFRGTLGITVRQCRPNDPESKGLVERANGYLETSFLPGRSVHLAAGFQPPVAGVVAGGEQPPAPGVGLPARGPFGCRPGRDGAAAAGRTDRRGGG